MMKTKSENIRYSVLFNKTMRAEMQFHKDTIRRSYSRYLELNKMFESEDKVLTLREYVKQYILSSLIRFINEDIQQLVWDSKDGGIII